jgi:hypothetical protein
MTICEHRICLHVYLTGEKLAVNGKKAYTVEYLTECINVRQHKVWVTMRSMLFHRKEANYLFHISLYISIYNLAHYVILQHVSERLHRHQVVINKDAYTEIYSEI